MLAQQDDEIWVTPGSRSRERTSRLLFAYASEKRQGAQKAAYAAFFAMPGRSFETRYLSKTASLYLYYRGI